ncbi:MAG TPA: MFS transporter [Gemmataceae bacterium]
MPSAHVRFISLWLSQTLRVLADWCLRMFVFREIYASDLAAAESAWPLVTAVFVAPFLILCPINGAISNGLPKRWVLVGAAGYCFLAVLGVGLLGDPWLACFGAMAVGSAVYSPTRYALLPAVAKDTGWSLARINSLIEMGGAAATAGGAMLGFALYGQGWGVLPRWPPALVASAALNLLAMVLATPAWFASDVRRPERPLDAVRDFFVDGRRILADREARYGLLGLAYFLALTIVGVGVMAQFALDANSTISQHHRLLSLLCVFLGVAAGSWLAGFQRHLYRALALVPTAALGMLVALAWALASGTLEGPCALLGLMGGLLNVPLRAFYQARVPADARGNAMAFMNFSIYLATLLLGLLLILLSERGFLRGPTAQICFLMALTAVGAVAALVLALRSVLEQGLELLTWPMYRLRAAGPGLADFPMRGPVLVVSNHAAWFDPIWLGKVVPRFVTPMMTSVYYDKPVIHWLMVHVAHTIRVPQAAFRREAPELKDAVAALDAGRLLLVFPEGALRRKEEQSVRYFGQGVWRILKERPETPVVACWIEGNWGSYTSYFKGPPTANKRLDWRRPIGVGLASPQILDAGVLADQRATRTFLMRACLEARKYLGLPAEELPAQMEEVIPKEEESGG